MRLTLLPGYAVFKEVAILEILMMTEVFFSFPTAPLINRSMKAVVTKKGAKAFSLNK